MKKYIIWSAIPVVLLLIFVITLYWQTDNLNTTKTKLDANQIQLSSTQAELKSTQESLTTSNGQLQQAQTQLSASQAQLNSIQSQIKKYTDGSQNFSSLSQLEDWLNTTIASDEANFLKLAANADATPPDTLPLCLYLQQKATISGYLLSTFCDHYYQDSSTTMVWYDDLVAFIHNSSYVIICSSTNIIIEDADPDNHAAGYVYPRLSQRKPVWLLFFKDMAPLSSGTPT